MKKAFQYIAIFLLMIVAGTSCEDNDNWRIITDLPEGVYVAGEATVYNSTATAAAFAPIVCDPADQVVEGVSGVYTWLKAGSPFDLLVVDAEGNRTSLGAGAAVTVAGAEGKTYEAVADATLSVETDGFYYVVYSANDHRITVINYTMSVIGDATPGLWDAATSMGAPVYNEANSIVEFKLSNVALNSKEMKFRACTNWQFSVPYAGGLASVAAGYGPEEAANLPEAFTQCFSKPGLPNFKVAKAGLYDVVMTYELRSKKFMGKAVYLGENPDAPKVDLPTALYIVGDAYEWNWDKAAELIPVNSHDGMFWGIFYIEAGNGTKFNTARAWNGSEFGANNEDPKGYGNIELGGSNMKVATSGYYQVLVTFKVSADKTSLEKTMVLSEPKPYVIGDCAAGGWDDQLADADIFTLQDGVYVSPALKAGKLRMCVKLEGCEWWQTEFIVLDNKIAYRGAGGDQAIVNATEGQKATLNFRDNTGAIQ